MRAPPVDVLLSWPTPDYENPDRTGPAGTIISIILVVLVTLLLAIRVYTRRFITHGFGWDDILILIAYVPALGFTATGIAAQEHFGWGTDVWDVRPERFPGSLKSGLASYVLFDLATSLTKLSMLALIYRLACSASKTLRYIVIGLMVFIVSNCVCFLLVMLLQCRYVLSCARAHQGANVLTDDSPSSPLHQYWEVSFTEQNCINEAIHLLVAGIINTSSDFIVVVLPLTIIHHLQSADSKLSPRQVVIVNVLFAAGFLASAAGGARTYITWVMTTHRDHNITRRALLSWLASTIELYVGIMAASAPATKPFFAKYLPSIIGATTLSRSRSRPGVRAGSARDSISARKGSSEHAASRNSLSTIHEVDESPVFNRPVEVSEPKRVTFYDVNKPLPRVDKGTSVYSFPIQLDLRGEEERTGSRGSDVLTEGRSFV